MTFSGNKLVSRVVMLLCAGMLGVSVLLASTLPGLGSKPAEDMTDATPSALLPAMMDTSASFADTGNAAPATAIGRETSAGPQSSATPMGDLEARVASGEPSAAFNLDGISGQQDHPECGSRTPESASMLLMTSGLLGLIGVRRFRK